MKTTAIVLAGIGVAIVVAGIVSMFLDAPGHLIASGSVYFFATAGVLALIHRRNSRRGRQPE